jgi:hypothetical protein
LKKSGGRSTHAIFCRGNHSRSTSPRFSNACTDGFADTYASKEAGWMPPAAAAGTTGRPSSEGEWKSMSCPASQAVPLAPAQLITISFMPSVC